MMQGLAGKRAERQKMLRCASFFGLSIKIHTQTVPGSHRALPGDLGGGRGEPRSAPTSRTAPTEIFRQGKGVKSTPRPDEVQPTAKIPGILEVGQNIG